MRKKSVDEKKEEKKVYSLIQQMFIKHLLWAKH